MARTIKIYTSYNEYSNTHYYRMFKVVDKLPAVGDDYEGGTVTELSEVQKDIENSDEAQDMDCYLVKYKDEEGEESEDYIAISRSNPNHMATVLYCDALPPTIEAASKILEAAIKTDHSPLSDELESYIDCCGVDEDETIMESYFRITPEAYEEVVASVPTVNYGRKNLTDLDGRNIRFEADINGIRIAMDVPYWWTDKDCMYIQRDLVKRMEEEGMFAPRTAASLSPATVDAIIDRIFDTIAMEKGGEAWIDEEGYPTWFDLISFNPREIFSISDTIVGICCKPFKEFIEDLGYTQASLCKAYHIPRRTVQDWYQDKNPCKLHFRLMFAELAGLLPSRNGKSN